MRLSVSIFFLLQFVNLSLSDHYKGGTISWKPLYPTTLTGPIQIIITERHSWTFTRYPCNQSTINSLGVYNDTQASVQATITCISSSANCTSSLYQNFTSPLYCTDFDTALSVSSGTYYTQQNLTANSIIDIAWRGASWTLETLTNEWSLVAHIDLTPINGKINTSPVTATIPVFKFYVNQVTVIQILAADTDTEQTVRCRWSNQLPLDECGDACFDLPNGIISPIDCSITWTAVLRTEDVANGLNTSTYIVAITAEDFVNASSATPLSSIPHQMLVYVYIRPANICSIPTLSATTRRNQACLALSVNGNYNLTFIGQVSCYNDSIVDFITSSPLYMQKTSIVQLSNYTWVVYFGWTPRANQIGLQPFCVAAVDNHGQSSIQWCMTFVVGGASNPSINIPAFVQSTISPVGTVMATQTRFSIQATMSLKRTIRNNTFITIYKLSNNAQVYQIDCKYSPDIYFINQTIVFYVRNPPWTLGTTYFITLTEGVATADEYCGTESYSIGGNGYWRFTVWNPAMSSTTTPSTTTSTATTHTVTTRILGTTTYNTLYTTTGLPVISTITTTSTTSTTSTSATTSTTTSATTTTTTTTTTTEYVPDANVLYPKDMETQCLQPVAIAATIITIAIIPLHFYGLITLFVKMNSHFQKETLRIRSARRLRLKSALNHEEEESFV